MKFSEVMQLFLDVIYMGVNMPVFKPKALLCA